MTLKKILRVFKTFFTSVMKIKTSLPLFRIKFNKICKNYALKILQIHDKHSIKLKISSDFSSHANKIKLNWLEFLNWNIFKCSKQIKYIQTNSNSDISANISVKKK